MSTFVLLSANTHCDPYPVYPLAVSYLATHLQEHIPALSVQAVDMNGTSFDGAIDQVVACQPDFVGISLRNIDNVDAVNERCFIDHYCALMAALRKRLTVPIIIGGAGFSIFPELLCAMLQPDYAIKGEGEVKLAILLQCLLDGRAIPAMAGFYRKGCWDTGGETVKYLQKPKLGFDAAMATRYWQQSGMLNVQTKRGCPYSCVYCTYPLIDGRKVRTLDIASIVDSMRDMQEKYAANYVFFTDSVFNIKHEFNRRLAHALIDADLKFHWGAYFSPFQCAEKDLALYKAAGLVHVEFGTESLADTTLGQYGKPFKVSDVLHAAEACRQLEIDQAHFLILGGPGETRETLNETFANAERLPPCVLFPYVGVRIYPGTPLQALAIREGIVHADDDLLRPAYYCSTDTRLEEIRQRVAGSARRWVFSDENHAEVMLKIRQRKHRSGPLWELLIR